MQYSRDEEFVQNPLHSPQVFHVQGVRRQQLIKPHLQGQSTCKSTCMFGNIVREEDIVRILFESLPMSYEYLITALETMLMKDLTMKYVTACLMPNMSKCKKKDQGKDEAMVSHQNKVGDLFSQQGVRTYFYCNKLSHNARCCYKMKNKKKENAKNAKNEDEFVFAM